MLKAIFTLFLMIMLMFGGFGEVYAQDGSEGSSEESDDDTYFKRRGMALRMFSESSLGMAIGAVGGFSALVFGVMRDNDVGWPEMLAAGVLYPLSVGSGVLLGGWLCGGRASWWSPFVGAAGGGVVAYSMVYFLREVIAVEMSAFFLISLPIVGSVLGYELSDWHRSKKRSKGSDRVIMPLMIQGRF